MTRHINLIIAAEHDGLRFDQAVANLLPDISRSRIQKWIKSGELTLNTTHVSSKQKVFIGDKIFGEIIIEDNSTQQPQNLPLDIIFEDSQLIVINKPAGLVVHPGAGNPDNTLLNALLYHHSSLQHVPRAGIVHRLDKETSGIMVVAKTIEAQFDLVKQLQARTVKRQYLALALGEFSGGGTIETQMGRASRDRLRMAVVTNGKLAITHYRIKQRYTGLTLLHCQLETGRTHQIRVHLAHIHHPLVGDPLYGKQRLPKGLDTESRVQLLAFPRQALHAEKLQFSHPVSKQALSFSAPIADDFKQLINSLN